MPVIDLPVPVKHYRQATPVAPVPVAPEVDPLIPLACTLLDTVLTSPRWDELINLNTLDLVVPAYCVLGQTSQYKSHHGKIPADGVVPWYSYGEGSEYLTDWIDAHPQVADAIGANYELVGTVFGATIEDLDDGTTQDDQWRRWITYRQAMRAQAMPEAV